MLLSDLNGVFSKIQNVAISDEECEAMIEAAALQAGDEIRHRGRMLRQQEIERIRSQREREEHHRRESQNGAEQLARANAHAESRQAELKAVEDRLGPPRGFRR